MTWNSKKRTGRLVAILMVVGSVVASSGCDGKLRDEFRETTSASLESGLATIAAGLIEGAFAVYDPGTSTNSNETTSN